MEYPFKDLMPLDEVLEREGYYKDWTHLDPEVFYSLRQISEYIKTKGYGVDVRLLIAQLAEHFGLKTTQVVDLGNLLQAEHTSLKQQVQRAVAQVNADRNALETKFNQSVAQMQADKDAVIANATVDSEVILARGGKATLGQRLDETEKVSPVSIMKYEAYKTEQGYWDGALEEALKNHRYIKFPAGTFRFSSDIYVKDNNVTIEGYGGELGGGTTLSFDNDGLFLETGLRYAKIKNLYIKKNGKSGRGITFGKKAQSSLLYSHFIDFENVHMSGFDTSIEIEENTMLWNCKFNDMRIEHSNLGFKTNSAPSSSFGIMFEKVYWNECERVLDIQLFQGQFNGCNLGINNVNAINIKGNSYIRFENSNFECDKLVEGNSSLFNMRGRNIEFKNSTFYLRGVSTVTVFSTFSTLYLLSFESIRFSYHPQNEMLNFWDANNCDAARNGAVQFLAGSDLLPRPTNYPQLYKSRYVDKDRNALFIHHKDNNYPLSVLGEIALLQHTEIPIVKRSSGVTDFMGNAIDGDFPVRISNNRYLDSGTVTIGTNGVATIKYNRQRKGRVILSATPHNHPDLAIVRQDMSDGNDSENLTVIRVKRWDDTNKTWVHNLTQPMTLQWYKVSE